MLSESVKSHKQRLTWGGGTQTFSEWADERELKVATVFNRLKRGDSLKRALRPLPMPKAARDYDAIRVAEAGKPLPELAPPPPEIVPRLVYPAANALFRRLAALPPPPEIVPRLVYPAANALFRRLAALPPPPEIVPRLVYDDPERRERASVKQLKEAVDPTSRVVRKRPERKRPRRRAVRTEPERSGGRTT